MFQPPFNHEAHLVTYFLLFVTKTFIILKKVTQINSGWLNNLVKSIINCVTFKLKEKILEYKTKNTAVLCQTSVYP